MSAKQSRPHAQAVTDIAAHVGKHPMESGSAKVSALFAIAHALLDVAEPIDHHADSTRKEGR